MNKVLIIEDDREINSLLCKMLEDNQYYVECAYCGLEGMNKLYNMTFDIVLLDLMLPYMSGDKILTELRSFSQIPVLVISAKGITQMKVDLLRLGADDYITKPFDIEEILARIESSLRRYRNQCVSTETLLYKDIKMNLFSKSVQANGIEISLTTTEFSLLEVFLRNPTKVFSKANLFESVWQEDLPENDNTLNVHVSRLRHKLKKANPNEEYIQTLWGMGYRIAK